MFSSYSLCLLNPLQQVRWPLPRRKVGSARQSTIGPSSSTLQQPPTRTGVQSTSTNSLRAQTFMAADKRRNVCQFCCSWEQASNQCPWGVDTLLTHPHPSGQATHPGGQGLRLQVHPDPLIMEHWILLLSNITLTTSSSAVCASRTTRGWWTVRGGQHCGTQSTGFL